jgi:hypothetical protein
MAGPILVSLLVLEDAVEVCGSSSRVTVGMSWLLGGMNWTAVAIGKLAVASMYMESSTNFQLAWCFCIRI